MFKPVAYPFVNRAALPSALVNAVVNELANVATMNGAALSGEGGSETQVRDAIQAYVQAAIAGTATDYIVRFTTTANIALTGLGTQAGGDWAAALTAGDLILVQNQATGIQNGWYVAAAGAWARAVFSDTSAEIVSGVLTQVKEGATLADTIWMLVTDGAVTLGTTALSFQWSGGLNGVTAYQFDDSRKLATTSFVQRALGSYRGVASVVANTTLDASHVGKAVRNNGANTITLPLASSLAPGASITIANQDGGVSCTVQRNGAESIERNGSGITSFILNFGETITLFANASSWTIVGGLGTASLAASGYQKLPSGLIIQWGTVAATANPVTVTLPITFPNAALHAVGVFRDLSTARIATVWAYSASQVKATGWTTAGAVVTTGEVISFIVIGY